MKTLLITQRSEKDEKTGEIRDALDSNWHIFLKECDCIAIPIPNNIDYLTEILNVHPIDGIILSGGNTPVEYGGSCAERDAVDKSLIRYAIDKKIPLIGVCRGMQSICIFFSGSLKHVSNHVRVHHIVNGYINDNVNSYHEWAPDYPGKDVDVICTSEDGQIEMIRHNQFDILGIMWHPEREQPFKKVDVELFKNVFKVDE